MKGDPVVAHPVWRGRGFEVDEKLCFIIMPFQEAWSDTVYEYISEAVIGLGYEPVRADESRGEIVMEDVWKLLNEALFVVADVTSVNPNVFYELGVAHALGKEVILIAQDIEHIPFDINHFRLLLYKGDVSTARVLRAELPAYIKKAAGSALEELRTGSGRESFAPRVEIRLKEWFDSGYDYEKTLNLNILYALRGSPEVGAMTEEMKAYCLVSALYRRPWDRPSDVLPFWVDVNKFNPIAGKYLGVCMGLAARGARFLAAYVLQLLPTETRQFGIEEASKYPDAAALLRQVIDGSVEAYLDQEWCSIEGMDPSKRAELLADFQFIAQSYR